MQHTHTTSVPDAEFKKRRNQKNWIVMLLILSGVALIWAVTMLKFDPTFKNMVGHDQAGQQNETLQDDPHAAPKEAKHAQ